MKCTVRRTTKNLRYRILTIRGEKYILDMGGASLWKMLFPFFYWLLPNLVYKVEDPEIAEELTAPTVKQKAGSSQYGWIAAASIVLGNMLGPLLNYFDVDIPVYLNIIIVTVIFIFVFLLIFFLSRMFLKKLNQVINLKELPKGQLWILPVPFKFVFFVTFMYAVGLGFAVMGTAAYIADGNWFILLTTTVSLFVALVMPSLTTIIEGNTRVKFLGGKRAKVFPHN